MITHSTHPPRETKTPRRKAKLPHVLHLEVLENDVGLITFDHPDKAVNIFDEATLDELALALVAAESLSVKALIFASAKPDVFLAGADLDALANVNEERLEQLIRKGQEVFDRIARLPVPTMAAIHGACLGGGLELALACDQRIMSDDKKTRLGLPETLLGILPAWGGSTRLPRLAGLPRALDLILGGKALKPYDALRAGLVDEVVPKEVLLDFAHRHAFQNRKRAGHFLTNNPLSQCFIACAARKRVLAKTRGHYPAQEAAIQVASAGASGSIQKSLRREEVAVLKLARSPEAAQLMRLFRLQERAKKFRFDPKVEREGLVPIQRTAVIGAGVMGSGIAQWLSAKRYPVLLRDIDREKVAKGMEAIRNGFRVAVKRRILTKHDSIRCLDLVTPSAEPVSLQREDLVVEAAVEDFTVKKQIFADLCSRSRPETILATNTSALPITVLCEAKGVTHPERIIGLHFFNPVNRMKLVEVVVTECTAPEVVERTLQFLLSIGKLPVVVKDSPGFLVNRVLMPYLIEAGHLIDRGVAPEKVDRAMLDFGMPMGPIRLLDEVGLDVAAHVAVTMREAFGDRFELPRILTRLVKQGHLGRKTGEGFYRHNKGRAEVAIPSRPDPGFTEAEIADRLSQLMIDESKRCLAEGIARDEDDIDLAMVMGTGFAPFRGGPLSWDRLRNEAENCNATHGRSSVKNRKDL